VAALLDDPAKGRYFVAEMDGAVAGQLMLTYEWSDWRNGNIWWLQSVYVKRECRGQGVFRTLFRHVQKLASARGGVCALRLYMHAENSTARLTYARAGMKLTPYQVYEIPIDDEKEAP
jgi:GNAT superfamily N-acetyltransferase